jgi:hypothetical protein
MAQTQTAPAQTQAEIVAALRAENAKSNSAVWNAVKRVPGLIAGAGVDTANLLLGALAGRGLQGLSKKPVGGSESINEAFGLKKSDNATQNAVESVLGMMSPGGAAKAIIIPFTAAQATRAGVSKIADQALRTYARTGDNAKVLAESNKALKSANFPMAVEGMYVGPDMKLRASLSNQAFKPNFNKALFTADPATGAVNLGKPLLGGQNTVRAETVLPHESLYKLMPELKGTRIIHDPNLDNTNVLGYYNVGSNRIGLPSSVATTSESPFISTLIHELTHGGQGYGFTRSGSQMAIDPLVQSIEEAKQMGSFRTKQELDDAIATLIDIDFASMYPTLKSPRVPADPDAYLYNLYRNIFGEVEARQSQNMTPGRLPNIQRLERSY